MRPLLVFWAVLAGTSAFADASAVRRSSPLIGTWAVDTSRLPIPPEARPKRVTITFGDAGEDQRTMQVSIVDSAGKEITATSTYTLDGKPVSISGSPEADTGAVKMPSPDVLILALAKGGSGTSTRIYTASPNGKEMVETAVYFGKNGSPILRTNYFSRVK